MEEKRILMIDDDKDFLESQSVMLRQSGYVTYVASGSKEGYEKAKNFEPDLIILDVNMEKEFSGFGLHRKIREDKQIGKTPIVFLTGIATYDFGNQLIVSYNEMSETKEIEVEKFLRVKSKGSEVALESFEADGRQTILLLDSFVTKSKVEENLIKEIERFLGEKVQA